MLYRGEYFELVTPQRWPDMAALDTASAQPAIRWAPRTFTSAGHGQSKLWVDDTVLSCCNKAYDLAVVHRGLEVGPEHLIHAMTLVARATEDLIARNINVRALKQESAGAIATPLPSGYASGQVSPAISEEFARVLRHAADHAYAQRSPITIEHILDVLCNMKNDQTSHNFIHLHSERADWHLRGNRDAFADDERGRDGPSVTDDIQNTRLNELERLVHKLSDEVSENKSVFQEILAQLQGASTNEKPQKPNSHANGSYEREAGVNSYPAHGIDDILERLYAMQRNVDGKFAELARGWDMLGNRIDDLEKSVAKKPKAELELDHDTVDTVAKQMARRLDDTFAAALENKLSALLDRKLATAVDEMTASLPNRMGNAFETRFANLLDNKLTAPSHLKTDIDRLETKLLQLESGLTGLPTQLKTLEETLKHDTVAADLKPWTQEMGQQLMQHVSEAAAEIHGNLEAFEARVSASSTSRDMDIEPLLDVIHKMEARVDDTSLLVQGFGDRFDELDRTSILDSVIDAATSKLKLTTDALDTRQMEHGRVLASIKEHVARIEAGSAHSADTDTLNMSLDQIRRESDATHNALIKINTNQQTLATAFDHWSKETRGQLTELGKKLITMSTNSSKPISDLTADMDKLQKKFEDLRSSIAQRPSIWKRFRIWLYGTDDWFEASWGTRQNGNRTIAKA